MTLTLYSGRPALRRASWPFDPNQALGPLSEALNAWAATARSPRVVLSEGKVAHLVRLSADKREVR